MNFSTFSMKSPARSSQFSCKMKGEIKWFNCCDGKWTLMFEVVLFSKIKAGSETPKIEKLTGVKLVLFDMNKYDKDILDKDLSLKELKVKEIATYACSIEDQENEPFILSCETDTVQSIGVGFYNKSYTRGKKSDILIDKLFLKTPIGEMVINDSQLKATCS